MLQVSGDKIVYTFDAETLWVEPWGQDSIRVRATMENEMPEKEWALLPQEENGREGCAF
jgi:alpha-D-xyloside xylohydrolase